MKYMKRRGLRMFAVAALLPMMVLAQNNAQATKPAAQQDAATQQVTQLVRDFLANVPKNDPKIFQEFFADDVIYTRAVGVTVAKADILKNIDARAAADPQAKFEADDFTVHPYGEMAVVNFRLIAHNAENGQPTTVYYRNTGTFLKRNGKWQAVAWQATKVPDTPATKP
ncbi:MAG TPA: nuclear transport factor 2 family protein [Candidatus Angelobacter sp.]|jgi:ketosteroid isomerase-like protein|nr:nuclear transport factor 2 family protein [Candidatus Angelobacter sp.]